MIVRLNSLEQAQATWQAIALSIWNYFANGQLIEKSLLQVDELSGRQ
jgi:hypothetical protein